MDKKSERRNAVRVQVSFYIHFKKMDPMSLDDIKDTYIQHSSSDRERRYAPDLSSFAFSASDRKFDKMDPAFLQIAETVCKKLDVIINLLQRKDLNRPDHITAICKNISMKGLLLHSRAEIKKGDLLELSIDFPGFPPTGIVALGAVKDVSAENGVYCGSVYFNAINEDDKEALVSYIFKRQRELLRKRKYKRQG